MNEDISNPGNVTQNGNPDLNNSLPPASTPVNLTTSTPVNPPASVPVTPPVQVVSPVAPKEKYAFPDHSNKDLQKKLRGEKAKSFLKYLPLIIALIIAAGLGYLYYNTRNALATQNTATDKAISDYNAQKAIVDAKSNCDVCPAVPVEATPAPTTTTTTKKSTSTAQESVVAPPAPPAD